MIFSIEVLQANHGDCLLVHYGKNNDPKTIVIDGGPPGIYRNVLKPRLLTIKKTLSPENPLSLSMVMVSHMDDDHVNGILALTDDILDKQTNNSKEDFEVTNLWFNTFDDIIGNIEIPIISAIGASTQPASLTALPQLAGAEHHIEAIVASTGQGRQLRDNAKALSTVVNFPFKEFKKGKANLVRGDGKASVIKWDTGVKITVVHPNKQRLQELQKQWDKDLETARKKGDTSIIIASIIKPDTSPFNLSSIVCLIEAGGKKMLLTGDARSDDILNGLKENKLIGTKGLHVDVFKMAHHGSIRNATPELFQKVTADNYIISADGSFDNPDKPLLEMLAENVKKGTLHLTNHDGKKGLKAKLDTFIKKLKKDGSKLKINFRKDDEPSIVVNLLDEIDF